MGPHTGGAEAWRAGLHGWVRVTQSGQGYTGGYTKGGGPLVSNSTTAPAVDSGSATDWPQWSN